MTSAFEQTLGRYPRCANAFEHGVYRKPPAEAMRYSHIQVNQPWLLNYLAFDVDRWGAVAAPEEAELPAPTWTMLNPINGHAHLMYQLADPVIVGGNARIKPQVFYKDVLAGMTMQMSADPSYVAAFVKTPHHPAWQTIATNNRYELGELKEYLQVNTAEAKATIREIRGAVDPVSRTLTLFNLLRRWAYRAVADYRLGTIETFRKAVTGQAKVMVAHEVRIAHPGKPTLTTSEYISVAASVARWTWSAHTGRMTNEDFRKLQQVRIMKRWGDSSTLQAKVLELRSTTRMSCQAIADQVGVHRNSVANWLNKQTK